MAKRNIGSSFNIYPMPVVIAGTVTDGRPNFMTAAWVTKLNSDPPLLGLCVARKQHTAKGIRESGEFSVSVPGVDQAMLADYCGLVSGRDQDKTSHIEVFGGALRSAPMVRQCPLTMECRLTQTVELPGDFLFIGEVINVYASESVLTDGAVDVAKLHPFALTLPDKSYWALGEKVGQAWEIGKSLLQE
jgi:flavin reductase (DIM6/NTAB) family NADH-FMN oxidoreductase RutF